MKNLLPSIIIAATLGANVAAASTEYWFNTDNGARENKFSLAANWFNIWPGGTDYHNMGNTPSDITDAKIRFQSKELNIDVASTIQASTVFSSDKVARVYGETLTLKNLVSTSNNSVTITEVTGTNGSMQIDSNLKLESSSTAKTTYFLFMGNFDNNQVINGDISVASTKIDGSYVKYEDDLLRVKWANTTSKSNIIFNGAIDLTRYSSDTSSWAARLNVLGSNSRTSALTSPYVYLGGATSNNMSVKLNDRAHLALGKTDGAIAANQIEARGNSAVTFFENNQVKKGSVIRAIDARNDLAHVGNANNAKTALFLNLNGTTQSFSNISFEWDKWQSGGTTVIETGTNQFVRIDFTEGGGSQLTFTSTSATLDLSENLVRNTSDNSKLTTDAAKVNNRINAIGTGLILANFENYDAESGTGDLLIFGSDKIKLNSSTYYDDINLISTDLVDHIWLEEGTRGVDYLVELKDFEGAYMLVINYNVPEPATTALFFGAFIAAFVCVRRFKK